MKSWEKKKKEVGGGRRKRQRLDRFFELQHLQRQAVTKSRLRLPVPIVRRWGNEAHVLVPFLYKQRLFLFST